ncbi:MAG: N-acetyl-D-myo-inositol-2-amino-2-deoxy-alpha- D-glucopyranoside deacetylase [Pseudonocardia sp.]|nr:N-acetyl-D-myo-inositol-2-amino-2-deoxy-alpha- D-glucopyranoside deacetylase [Pseudonocardia sp.]
MAPTAARRLLFVHAHPDDETLATGGTIARYAAAPDTSVTLVTCTLGEQGEIAPPELALLAAEHADQLGGYRIGELAAACEALGVRDHRFLGGVGRWRDTGMVLTGHGTRAAAPAELRPTAFARPEAFDEQVEQLVAVLQDVRPQVVVSYDPNGGYGHPDHVRAHEITMAAAAKAAGVQKVYWTASSRADLDAGLAELAEADGLPFRLPEPDELATVPGDAVTTRIDVSDQLAAKVAALRAHRTQLTVFTAGGHPGYALTNDIAQPVLRTESYTRAEPAARESITEADLFAGVEPS